MASGATNDLALPLAIGLSLYVVVTYAIGFGVKSRVQDAEDYLVAGRRLSRELSPEMLALYPEEGAAFLGWLSILMVAALGNLPGQDLLQRIFAAKSARTASLACLIAGVAYVSLGAIPVLLGLAANLLVPDSVEQAILPALASGFLSPVLVFVFAFALVSAVLSTIDSALLSPSASSPRTSPPTCFPAASRP